MTKFPTATGRSASEKPMLAIVGQRPRAIWVQEGEGRLILECDEGALTIGTEGDCCSETWFADLIGVKQFLRGTEVTGIEEIEMPEDYNVEDGRTRQEVDGAYGIKVTTDQGELTIVYRNSSNGYYGGNAWYRWESKLPEGYSMVEEDWQA